MTRTDIVALSISAVALLVALGIFAYVAFR